MSCSETRGVNHIQIREAEMNSHGRAKMRSISCIFSIVAVLAVILAPGFAGADSNILFIMDASGSMNDRMGNELKITVAKRVLSDLLKELPAEAKVGLMAYGHTISKERATACTDISVISPVGSEAPSAIAEKVGGLRAMGMTPIAKALGMAISAFKNVKGEDNHIILISDGLETCGGDPCRAAKRLTEANIKARVHVIGFDVSAAAQKELACIPKMGNGRYFSANNVEELKLAIAEAKKVTKVDAVVEAPKVIETPEPPKPVKPKVKELKEVWRDDFEGQDLADDWEILHPDPDNFIVEDGKLLMISSAVSNFAAENIPNLFRLDKDMPKGDWVLTAKLDIDFQTRHDRIFFGLYADKANYMVSVMSVGFGGCAPGASYHFHLYVTPTKVINGKVTQTPQEAWRIGRCDGGKVNDLMAKGQPYLLRIVKKGRMYTSSMKMEGEKDPKWIELKGLKLLRSKGKIAIGAYRSGKEAGEVTIEVDWIKLEAPADSE